MSLVLPQELTLSEARATVEGLVSAIEADPSAVLDASGLRSLDTSAIAVLLECRRVAEAHGRTLTVVGAPPKLGQLARLYGVDGLLGI